MSEFTCILSNVMYILCDGHLHKLVSLLGVMKTFVLLYTNAFIYIYKFQELFLDSFVKFKGTKSALECLRENDHCINVGHVDSELSTHAGLTSEFIKITSSLTQIHRNSDVKGMQQTMI